MNRADLARLIDHTLLRAEATHNQVLALCSDARELGVYAVCVSPTHVPAAKEALAGSGVVLATVAGFPSGAHFPQVKAEEAQLVVRQGADEVDMVVNLGALKSGFWGTVEEDIFAVRRAIPNTVLKVILETAILTGEEIVQACQASQRAGADFVKTSTGLHPSGGASLEAVQLMHATVGGKMGIKASGGVSSRGFAEQLVAVGATRLGMSATAAVLSE